MANINPFALLFAPEFHPELRANFITRFKRSMVLATARDFARCLEASNRSNLEPGAADILGTESYYRKARSGRIQIRDPSARSWNERRWRTDPGSIRYTTPLPSTMRI